MTNKTIDFDYYDNERELNGTVKLPVVQGRRVLDHLFDSAKQSLAAEQENADGGIKGEAKKEASFEQGGLVKGLMDVVFPYNENPLSFPYTKPLAVGVSYSMFPDAFLPPNAFEVLQKAVQQQKSADMSVLEGWKKYNPDHLSNILFNRDMENADCFCIECMISRKQINIDLGQPMPEFEKTNEGEPMMKPSDAFQNKVKVMAKPIVGSPLAEPSVGSSMAKPEKLANQTGRPIIVLFNAPPRAGKDSCAAAIEDCFDGVVKLNFKDSLYKRSAEILGYDLDFWTKVCQSDDLKDKPMVDLTFMGVKYGMLTPRQVLITIAENFLKKAYGNNIFAIDLAASIRKKIDTGLINQIFVIPDCGFSYEADTIRGSFPFAKVVVVHIEREGCSFDSDSRDWVEGDHCLVNQGDLNNVKNQAVKYVETLIGFNPKHWGI